VRCPERDTEGVEVWTVGKGIPTPEEYGVWERHEPPGPQQGPGQSPDRKRIWLFYCCEYYSDGNVDDSEVHVFS